MNNRTRRIIVAAAAVVFVISGMLLMMNLIGPRVNYLFRPEPALNRDMGERRLTADREPVSSAYGYDSLTEEMQADYRAMEDCFTGHGESFDIETDSLDDYSRIRRAYDEDHPEQFWNASTFSYAETDSGYTVYPDYTFTEENIADAKERLDSAVAAILEKAPEQASDYEMELYLHDALITHCEYDITADHCYDAYGALAEGRAVCSGYARAFSLLCRRMGIRCISINGESVDFSKAENQGEEKQEVGEDESADSAESGGEQTLAHQWNCVNIEGDWYQTDVTWDDRRDKMPVYHFFNITAAEMEQTHTIYPVYTDDNAVWEHRYNSVLPDCTATAFNYYNKTGAVIHDLGDDNDMVALLIDAARNRRITVNFKIDEALDADAVSNEFRSSYCYKWMEGANHYNRDNPKITEATYFYYNKKQRSLILYPQYER